MADSIIQVQREVQQALEVAFRPACKEDVPQIAQLEAACYPADEAASLEKIAFRQASAGRYFLAMFATQQVAAAADADACGGEAQHLPEKLIGFVNATLTSNAKLTHETMAKHEPEGNHLCIHSVAVDPTLRRRGLGQQLLRAYMTRIAEECPEVARVSLIAKESLAQTFYCDAGVGFGLVGPSDVVHGKDLWYECTADMKR